MIWTRNLALRIKKDEWTEVSYLIARIAGFVKDGLDMEHESKGDVKDNPLIF